MAPPASSPSTRQRIAQLLLERQPPSHDGAGLHVQPRNGRRRQRELRRGTVMSSSAGAATPASCAR